MITISLCMIVKNEEKVLARCLDSFKDVVDEIIIIDTGSTDSTKIIAGMYTERIYDFTWVNNFSIARNESFAKATMDYCMWTDADDILNGSEKEKLLIWKQQADIGNSPDIAMMKYAISFDNNDKPSFLYYRERLIKRSNNFKWKGRVHETITPTGNIEYLDIYLEHRSVKTSYSKRNLNIYEEMKISGEAFSDRDIFYYARELYYHGKYNDALNEFEVFLSKPALFIENHVEACRFAAYCCYPLNEESRALDYYHKALSYRVPSGELCCDIGMHYYDRKKYEQAIFWYLGALHSPMTLQNGGFIQPECYGYLPCIQLSVCYYKTGDMDNSLKYHKLAGTYNPNGELYLKNDIYFCKK